MKAVSIDRRWRWLAVLAWMLVIFAFSHQPYSGRESEKYLHDYNVPVRKLGHITEYLVLFVLVRWAISKSDESSHNSIDEEDGKSSGREPDTVGKERDTAGKERDTAGKEPDTAGSAYRIVSLVPLGTIAFLLTASYAALDEWHQGYVPGRSSTWSDVGVDACGILLGVLVWAVLRSFLKRVDAA